MASLTPGQIQQKTKSMIEENGGPLRLRTIIDDLNLTERAFKWGLEGYEGLEIYRDKTGQGSYHPGLQFVRIT